MDDMTTSATNAAVSSMLDSSSVVLALYVTGSDNDRPVMNEPR